MYALFFYFKSTLITWFPYGICTRKTRQVAVGCKLAF